MKFAFVFLLLSSLIPLSLQAQDLELHANLNSGLYSFHGGGTTAVSRINFATYTNNPYGTRGGLSYGLSFDLKKTTRSKFIYGADLGYEMLRSKVKLDYSDVIGDIASSFAGRTYLNTSFINLFPFLGTRFNSQRRPIDLVAGLDIGYILSANEDGDAKSTDNAQFHIETSGDRKTLNTDFRPRIQLSTSFDRIGCYIGYSYGLKSYKGGMIGSSPEAYARMLRFGLSYRLK
jgi:hypothetical protein